MIDNNGVSIEEIKKDRLVAKFLEKADAHLNAIGYTEHGFRHANISSERAKAILESLGCSEKDRLLAAIAGLLHDIGNMVARVNHGQIGAMLTYEILKKYNMETEDIATVMSAIGNHDEDVGEPTDIISAALVLGDKSDVHRTRVRNTQMISFDIHDRVNYAVTESAIEVYSEKKAVILRLKIDTTISQVMEYFEIFLSRMILSKKAARILGCEFQLIINDVNLL
ncbi:MAG: HD domain-containing protein [Nitrospirota bacterium]